MNNGDHFEKQIQDILDKFQPQPSVRFYQRMKHAPWLRKETRKSNSSFRWEEIISNRKLRLAAVLVFALLVPIVGLLMSTSIEGVAQNLMRFIRPAANDHIAIPVGLPSSQDINSFSAPGYFSLTAAQAQEQADFQLDGIDHYPSNLAFNGAHFNSNTGAVIQRYSHPAYTLYFSQRHIKAMEEYSEVGGSAPVEVILIHGIDAEYVSGGWRLDTAVESIAANAPGTQTNIEADWDAQIPQKLLRWQKGNLAYEILVINADKLDKSELIKIAESVK